MKKIVAWSASVLLLVASGCQSSSGLEGRSSDSRVQIVNRNSALGKYLKIASMKSFTVNKLLEANITLFSNYSKDMSLQYKFTWYDQSGRVLNRDNEAWKPFIAYGNQTIDIVGVAPSLLATEYKFVIRALKQD